MLPIVSCHKDDEQLQEAVVTGRDLRNCACCGGIMINMSNDTSLYAAGMLLTDSLPSDFMARYTLKFPMRVRLNWLPDTNGCGKMMNKIIVTQIVPR